MSRTLYLDCVGGVAGDMLLAALLDAGAAADVLHAVPERLGLRDVRVEVERVERHGVAALHVEVLTPDGSGSRSYRELRALAERAESGRALEALDRLARAEGRVHGVAPEEVHFHELGAADTLVDICGVVALVDDLGPAGVACSPLPLARGLVRSAHGLLPLPAPAVLELLREARAPVAGAEGEAELVTPTGAALVATLADEWGPLPPLVLEAVGNGAGTRDSPDRPNLVRALLGSRAGARQTVSLLETNLDDFSPELVPDAAERCFAAGALDVWTVPAQMKKGRPGFVLAALARPEHERAVAEAVLTESSALGVRVTRLDRYELEREERVVELSQGSVRVKLGLLDGRVVNVAPEHDDCARVARAAGVPVKEVWAAALAAARSS